MFKKKLREKERKRCTIFNERKTTFKFERKFVSECSAAPHVQITRENYSKEKSQFC